MSVSSFACRADVPQFSVIVMENSPDSGCLNESEAAEILPGTRVIRNRANRGFAAGNNPGIQEFIRQDVKFIWLLNNDTLVHPDALRLAWNTMQQHSDWGVCGMKIWDDTGTHIQCIGGGLLHPKKIYTADNFDPDFTPDFITGCSMLIRREALMKTGLLDETFFMYFEDVDFCLRIRRAGFAIGVSPESEIYHFGGSSGESSKATAYSFQSAWIMAEKYAKNPWISKWWILQTRLFIPCLKGDIRSVIRILKELTCRKKR